MLIFPIGDLLVSAWGSVAAGRFEQLMKSRKKKNKKKTVNDIFIKFIKLGNSLSDHLHSSKMKGRKRKPSVNTLISSVILMKTYLLLL